MHDVAIIGAGPAGLTAALYAGRYRLKTLLLEKAGVGGQIVLSSSIENFPGFPGEASPQELMEKLQRQAQEAGVPVTLDEVMEVKAPAAGVRQPLWLVRCREGEYEARSVIIATGAFPRRLGVDGEERFIGKGVSYCATCDAPFFRNKDIAVVGGGDRALEEAIFLASYAASVTLIHRRAQFRASKILEEKVRANPKIRLALETVIERIEGRQKVERLTVKNVATSEVGALECQGLFVFVGIEPQTAFLKGVVQTDEAGFIVTDEQLKTSQEGAFACGDCRKKSLYQVITACADGAIAAASAQKYLL